MNDYTPFSMARETCALLIVITLRKFNAPISLRNPGTARHMFEEKKSSPKADAFTFKYQL
jgi:hypothetical protein